MEQTENKTTQKTAPKKAVAAKKFNETVLGYIKDLEAIDYKKIMQKAGVKEAELPKATMVKIAQYDKKVAIFKMNVSNPKANLSAHFENCKALLEDINKDILEVEVDKEEAKEKQEQLAKAEAEAEAETTKQEDTDTPKAQKTESVTADQLLKKPKPAPQQQPVQQPAEEPKKKSNAGGWIVGGIILGVLGFLGIRYFNNN